MQICAAKEETELTSRKTKDLLLIAGIYLLSYAAGYAACFWIRSEILRYFVFDIAATVAVFVFSVLLHNSSVYDPYWSLTPMVLSIRLFASHGAWGFWQVLFLAVFNLWGLRLTVNWITVFTDFDYEDWRYRKFRDENPPALWQFLNFTGIHMVPTLVVFAGMLPLFEIVEQPMNYHCIPGLAVMLFGIAMEFFADRQMHAFLNEATGKTVCRVGLWNYSRHPNYLGEISVWLGTYLVMLPFCPQKWFFGVGALSVALLFNLVSIPMMEKRQLSRRPAYAAYQAQTSRLLLLPVKK